MVFAIQTDFLEIKRFYEISVFQTILNFKPLKQPVRAFSDVTKLYQFFHQTMYILFSVFTKWLHVLAHIYYIEVLSNLIHM
jgi:hypothetical protein